MKKSFAFVFALLVPCPAAAQAAIGDHGSTARETAAAPTTSAVVLDGELGDAAWAAVPPASEFLQREPDEGEPATQKTEIRFLYDGHALYVGARMYDALGAAGVESRLVRRDAEAQSDYLEVSLDTFHDHLGSVLFRVNPSGVKADAVSTSGPLDFSWDPVWEAATRVDSLGWTAELRIPFSQLRFTPGSPQTWGLQVERLTSRINERAVWAFWRANESGGPSRYGHLTGLDLPRSGRRVELMPYLVAQSSHVPPAGDPGDPFYDASSRAFRAGLDLRYLLTSNLTLTATVNPDFGQVEVDPAVVNLSAFETFFEEKRPFFVEGRGYFGFGPLWCFFCSNSPSMNLFYSRRIGRSPQGAGLARDAAEYVDVPEASTILAAAKVTGKTAKGWTVAAMDAVTGRETADAVLENGSRTGLEVEPPTNYLVTRVKRDFAGGNAVVGGIVTSTMRSFRSPELRSRLPGRATSAGADGEWWWKDRTYHLLASAAVSEVGGDSAAIGRLQRASARYFQRPDRDHGVNGLFSDAYDPAATGLRGYGFYTRLAKESGDWLWEAATSGRSPGFEINDLGFSTRSDYVWFNGNLVRSYTEPTPVYRRLFVGGGGQQRFNFDADRTEAQLHGGIFGQLANYWDFHAFAIRGGDRLDDRLTRGGPVVKVPGSWYYSAGLTTDARKRWQFMVNPTLATHSAGTDHAINLSARYRPVPNVSITLGPRFQRSATNYQYVQAFEDPTAKEFGGSRYIFGDLVQRTLALDTRLNATFSPTLSLELFAQPFISSGHYSAFREFERPREMETRRFGSEVGTVRTAGTGDDREYFIDPDGVAGPANELSFGDPDFTLRSLRGNAVLRWEYTPGSTLFLVWTQSRADDAPFGDLRFRRDQAALFRAPSSNVFLIKVNYWLAM